MGCQRGFRRKSIVRPEAPNYYEFVAGTILYGGTSMKRAKKISSLLIALILILAFAVPTALAYDSQDHIDYIRAATADTWFVESIFHWVIRGDTLESIAYRYGTTVDYIKAYNEAYFRDLAYRNRTTGLNVQLEHGIRLYIYDMVTVRHYVVRGDTLEILAGGALQWGGYKDATGRWVDRFVLKTTVAAIKEQNANFFNNLALLNKTEAAAKPLMESDNILTYYADWIDPYYNDDGKATYNGLGLGLPLFISVPVKVTPLLGLPALPGGPPGGIYDANGNRLNHDYYNPPAYPWQVANYVRIYDEFGVEILNRSVYYYSTVEYVANNWEADYVYDNAGNQYIKPPGIAANEGITFYTDRYWLDFDQINNFNDSPYEDASGYEHMPITWSNSVWNQFILSRPPLLTPRWLYLYDGRYVTGPFDRAHR